MSLRDYTTETQIRAARAWVLKVQGPYPENVSKLALKVEKELSCRELHELSFVLSHSQYANVSPADLSKDPGRYVMRIPHEGVDGWFLVELACSEENLAALPGPETVWH